MSNRKPTLCDTLMNEVIVYGGLPMRRCDVHTLCAEHLRDAKPKPGRFGADYFAFSPEALSGDALSDTLSHWNRTEPFSLDEAREIMK